MPAKRIRKRKNRKKAQMEIMGLAFVVILIVIGIMYLIKYQMEPPEKTHEEFGRAELPKTITTSIVEIKSNCNDEKMGVLIQDCGFGETITCTINNKKSCGYLKIAFEEILNSMLDRFGYSYKLVLKRDTTELFSVNSPNFSEGCVPSERAEEHMMYGVTLTLQICY